MNRWLMILITGVLIIASVLSALWFFENFELQDDENWIGYRGEARTNPYLAAQRFLELTDLQTESVKSIERLYPLPPPGNTLIFPGERYSVGAEMAEQLNEWIEAGGHLIVVHRRISGEDESDPLLDPFGVEKQEYDEDSEATSVGDSSDEESFSVDFGDEEIFRLKSTTPADFTMEDGNGAQLLNFHLGAGALTVLTNLDFAQNDQIADYDNAAFLYHLVHLPGTPGKVWIIAHEDMPPLWQWLWEKASSMVIALTLILLLWLWRSAKRLGPLELVGEPVRRSLREHIQASGRYLWRTQESSSLLESVRESLQRDIALQHPGWTQLSSEEMATRLATICKLEPGQIHHAMNAQADGKALSFTKQIHLLQQIRNRL